uniref:Ig-like domain-containing protein n=1 Tax=Prolemur simus TaxID=1328070 RepID=A0A8C8ZHN2_PROSS
MEPPSAPPHRGRVPWQGLLLTVSLVNFWNPPATAQLTVESVPPNAVEGKDVLLVHNLPQDAFGYNWYRGDKVDSSHRIVGYVTGTQVNTTGPAYSGRETIYPNGSLLFQNVTLNDAGHYTLHLIKADLQNEEVTGQFHSLEPPCSLPWDIWLFLLLCVPHLPPPSFQPGLCLPCTASSTLQLSSDTPTTNRCLGIKGTTQGKFLSVTCTAELPKPSITSNNSSPVEDEDSVALTCEPETQDTTYLWWINGQSIQDSDRVVMSLNNRTLILLNITRNDTGPYECENWNPVSGNRSDPVTLDVLCEYLLFLHGPGCSPNPHSQRPGHSVPLGSKCTDPQPWTPSLQQSTQELFIPNLTVDNSGSYTCVAHNSATGRNRTIVKTITVFDFLLPWLL